MANSENVENYAKSLVKHGVCLTIDRAMVESTRWHKKAASGLVEPLKCPYNPDVEIISIQMGNGVTIIEHKQTEIN